MNQTMRRWSVAALAALVALAMVGGGQGLADENEAAPTPAAMGHSEAPTSNLPANIHRGGCDEIGDVAYPLASVAIGASLVAEAAPDEHAGSHGEVHNDHMAAPSRTGATAAIPGASSSTIVPAALTEFLTTDHAIVVLDSALDDRPVIACGPLGGVVAEGDLIVGLHEMNDSGATGLAWLRDNGDGTTNVSIFLAHGLGAPAEEDEGVVAAASPAEAETVAVTMSEFSIALSQTTFRAGVPYAFAITNAGTIPHELAIERAGAVHEPLDEGGAVAMVHAITPGATATLNWTFTEPGSYQLACHEPGHYESGQVLTIEVVG